ncbi:hypothetical protein LCGC14_1591220 [marine sediment metagenome]|uniref:Uncharacterized protein n=1 Tax=marine sediment metagenome TaxID=412755 RepID=A0A0F9J063_9ZZZZ
MATQLRNIVRFAGLVVGLPVVTAHDLNNNGRALVPDFVIPTPGGFDVAVDATNVTVIRTADAPGGAVDVYVVHWHTLTRLFGPWNPPPGMLPEGSLTPAPLIIQPGTVSGVGIAGRYALPEKWHQENVVAAQANVALDQLVSTLFNSTKMIRAGSLLGFSTRLTEPITSGILTVEMTLNGAGTGFSLVHNPGSNPSGGEIVQAAGLDPFVAGDLVGKRLTTSADFLPITTNLETWADVDTD